MFIAFQDHVEMASLLNEDYVERASFHVYSFPGQHLKG